MCGCGSHCKQLYTFTFHLFTASQELQVIVFIGANAFDSSKQFKIICQAKNRKVLLYNAKCQTILNRSAIVAPRNSSYCMVTDELYYAFSMMSDSCAGLGQSFFEHSTMNDFVVTFPVDVGQSRLDTRQEVYLISWYTQDDVNGPCSFVLMQRTGVLNGI